MWPVAAVMASAKGARLCRLVRVVAAKRQVAIVRTLADELERVLVHDSVARNLHGQLANELEQLVRHTLEAAAAMSENATDP